MAIRLPIIRLRQVAEADWDRAIAWLAGRQHGVAARWQLLILGLSRSAIQRRIAGGTLHQIHRGVYSVGHSVLGPRGHAMAAVLTCGPYGVASHRLAAWLHGLIEGLQALDVTCPVKRTGGRTVTNHRLHLAEQDIVVQAGIPCTSLARTLFDLSGNETERFVEAAIAEAQLKGGFEPGLIDDVLARNPGRHATVALRTGLERELPKRSGSALAEEFLAIARSLPIGEPEVEYEIALKPEPGEPSKIRVDFCWPEARLVVETDGRAVHIRRKTFERDQRKTQRLLIAGWGTIRVTWVQVTQRAVVTGETVVAAYEQGLARAA